MVVTAESTQEQGLSAGKGEIAAAHGEAVEAVRRKKKARPHAAGIEFPGVRLRPCGTYGAQIWDPLRRPNVWLGTFGTAQDAAKAYDAAAVKLPAVERAVEKKKKAAVAERAAKKKTAGRPDAWTEFYGVRRGPSGKYVATIWHPLTRTMVYLGSFATAEDAAQAYAAAAVKLPCARKVGKKDAARRPYARTEFRGVSRTISGKYRAMVERTNDKQRIWLGNFAIAEEAARAYDAAAIKLHGGAAKSNFEGDDGIDVQAVGLEKATGSGFRGVLQQQSGKYSARIWDSAKRARLCLGTFGKAEDAARAFDAAAVRLHGDRAITNFKQPLVDLNDIPELPALDFSDSIIPGAGLHDLWTDLPRPELQPLDELLQDMDFTDVAA
ncbi:hypothetical protein QYE76_020431 [Lolium multiflorum]|uniref:AP2/ERF domain-containing protein n=1 Tax=Lolium multiflorum TaxID=4521 RepID=A0AAD8VQ07_LOLMU|nr:hypothetical protein QYE76_020431 [Lolium multiflorum]